MINIDKLDMDGKVNGLVEKKQLAGNPKGKIPCFPIIGFSLKPIQWESGRFFPGNLDETEMEPTVIR